MTSLRTMLPATVILLATASAVPASPYTFTNVADNSGEFSGFFRPRINNNGAVAIQASFDTQGQHILFTDEGGVRTTIQQLPNPPYTSFGGSPEINDAGAVAFIRSGGGTGGLF